MHAARTLRVYKYDEIVSSRNKWSSVILEFEDNRIPTDALVLPNVTYEFLLACSDLKKVKINIYSDDKVQIEGHTAGNYYLW